MTNTITITQSALFEMVLAAFEAYAVKHDGKEYVAIETHAQVWGKVNKTVPLKCAIEHVSIDTSAIQEQDGVTPNALSLDIKKDIASAFGDNYQHIGSYHTHPYTKDDFVYNANDIRDKGKPLYNFSGGDHRCEFSNFAIDLKGKKYSVALVMTIFATDKADDRKDGRLASNLFEFSLGNVKLWLKAQVFEHKAIDCITPEEELAFEAYELNFHDHFEAQHTLPIPIETNLECEFLESFGFYLKGFGRLEMDVDALEAEYKTKEVAENRWFSLN